MLYFSVSVFFWGSNKRFAHHLFAIESDALPKGPCLHPGTGVASNPNIYPSPLLSPPPFSISPYSVVLVMHPLPAIHLHPIFQFYSSSVAFSVLHLLPKEINPTIIGRHPSIVFFSLSVCLLCLSSSVDSTFWSPAASFPRHAQF